jgi:hypothetical protein
MASADLFLSSASAIWKQVSHEVVGLTARGVEDPLQPDVWIAGTLRLPFFSAGFLRDHHRSHRKAIQRLGRACLIMAVIVAPGLLALWVGQ